MNKLFLFFIGIFSFTILNAQGEVRINPVGLLFGSPDLSGEYIVSPDFGAELTMSLETGTWGVVTYDDYEAKKSGFGVMLAGKYYFSPEDDADRFYAGLYMRNKSYAVDSDEDGYVYGYKRSSTSAGLILGYKWVSHRNVVFEIGAGFGRAFSDKITWTNEDGSDNLDMSIRVDAFSRLAVGYRF